MQVYPAAQEFSRTPVQRIRPAPGLPAHPLLSRLRTEGLGANGANRLGVNAPRSSDPEAPTEGFSFRARVQPILDRHCVKCHDGKASNKNRPNLTGDWAPDVLPGAKRRFTYAYAVLTSKGFQTRKLNWYSNTGISEMLPPYAQGSGNSLIMNNLESAHHGVMMTEEEKRVFACWIDLAIPFGGSFAEATQWSLDDRKVFEYHQNKRAVFAEW